MCCEFCLPWCMQWVLAAPSGWWKLKALDIKHSLGSISIYKAPLLYLTGPGNHQREMNKPFEGGPVEIMVEDFLIHVHGEDQTDDDCKLWRVLDRSREAELKFNPRKEKLWVSEISYDGLVFSADGLNQTLKSKHSVSDKVCLKY